MKTLISLASVSFIFLFCITVSISDVWKKKNRIRIIKTQDCEVFEGKWVWDNVSRPLYEEWECPYMHKYTACETSGRPDTMYKNWRWQPNDCSLERFDAQKMLRILRGKTMMFVGDSVQRNQFDSLVCLIQSVIPDEKKSFRKVPPSMKVFTMEEFNASIAFYWAPFLVSSISDDADDHGGAEKLVYLDSISSHGEKWKTADILVFNSHLWWSENPSLPCVFNGKKTTYSSADAYEIAMKTWENWVKKNLNHRTQRTFFMGTSPTHWGSSGLPGSHGNCHKKSLPSFSKNLGDDINTRMEQIVREELGVTYMDITRLSQYRIDAHTSYYGKFSKLRKKSGMNTSSKKYGDCLHWCLPGVPDTWNELLFHFML